MDRGIYLSLSELKNVLLVDKTKSCTLKHNMKPSPYKPIALLFRQIATPSYEVLLFVRKAKRLGLEPYILEHRTDLFSVHNEFKRSLVSLPIMVGKDSSGRAIMRRQKLLHQDSIEKKRLEAIQLDTGESLISYHHRKLLGELGADSPRFIDLNDLVCTASNGAAAYYHDLLRMLTGRVILFEDFIIDKSTKEFFKRVVEPAFSAARNDMSSNPQIARLTQGHRAGWQIWNSYPPSIADDKSWIRQVEYRVSAA